MSCNWNDFNNKFNDAANKGNKANKKCSFQVLHFQNLFGSFENLSRNWVVFAAHYFIHQSFTFTILTSIANQINFRGVLSEVFLQNLVDCESSQRCFVTADNTKTQMNIKEQIRTDETNLSAL